ncbi:iron ABC transporter permease [uncultured Sphaerochaeta sp.]|uniref:ABC transporter permease n=1 Tax=uncultured Sphaerochaeta sp. TaxID=886478 RepID=UPI002A0A77DA|nr:iron ABC transporter permease [uncultured Sphaerochaeta sp.]
MTRVRYRCGKFLRQPHNIILLALAIVLSYLVIVPLITISQDTLVVHTSETMRIPGAKIGSFTWYHWKKAFFDADSMKTFYIPLVHSLICAVGSCFTALLIGGGFSWFMIRTDLKYKKVISKLFMLPYIMPSWTLALAWNNFFKNSLVGGPKGIFTALTGIETANWFAYGAFPIIVVTGIHYAPFAYILIGGILRNMDANLEEAAQVLHTSKTRMIFTITLPLVKPAVLSTIILVFSSGMSSFATPQFLGLPTRYYVLTTQLFRTLNGSNPGFGYVLALVLIFISMIMMLINQKMLGTRKSYTTVNGKSSNVSLFKLKKVRTPLSVLFVCIIFIVTIVPMISFGLESLITIPGNYSLDNISLQYWTGTGLSITDGVLVNPSVWKALKNTLVLAILCSLGAGTLGCLGGYAIVKRRGSKLSNYVNGVTFLPYLIPSMAFSAIYLSMFSTSRGPIPTLYGSFLLLVIIGSVKYLPMASRSGINSMFQISKTIEEAAIILGIPWRKRMTQILIPIQKTSVVSGYLLPFMSCMRELDLFVLLYTPSSILLTTVLFQYNSKGFDQYANAITLIIIILVVIANSIVNKLTGASIEKGIGA